MLADINSGTIFVFLILSAPYLGVSLYNLEHVILFAAFLIYLQEENLLKNSKLAVRCWDVIRWTCDSDFCYRSCIVRIGVVISAMPLWDTCCRAYTIHWFQRVQCKMAQLSTRSTQIHHFGHGSISITNQFQRIQYDQLHSGVFC